MIIIVLIEMNMPFTRHLLHLILLCLTLAATPLAAQQTAPATEPVTLPETLTPEAVNAMVARMSDDEVRALLIDRLDAVAQAAPEAPEPSLAQQIGTTVHALGASWAHVIRNVPDLISTQALSFRTFGERFQGAEIWIMFGWIVFLIGLAYGVERLVQLLVKRWQRPETGAEGDNLRDAVAYLFRRFSRELLGLVAFYVTLRLVGRAVLSPHMLSFAAPFVFYLIILPRLGAALSRFVLAPHRPDLRLVNVDDHWARYLHRNLIGLFLLIGFTIWIVTFNVTNGVPMGGTRLGFWLNTAVHLYIILIAWQARAGLIDMMRGNDPDRTEFDEALARNYPWFAIGVSVLMWLVVEIIIARGAPQMVALLNQAPHYVTMFWLLMAPAIDTLIRGLVRHLQPAMIGHGKIAEKAYVQTKRSYIRIGRVIAIAFVVLMIANAWNIDLRSLSASGKETLGTAIIQFIIMAAIGYILYEAVSVYINRRLAKEQTAADTPDQEAGEGGGAGGSRLATVLPLMLLTAQAAIIVIFALLAIGSLGIDITPLLAGAGILGLAIGFGAQKLVSDIVGGVFFLIDDAFRVGEYVDVGGTTGTVEKISIRSMQLRHHRGPVHTIPYGEIQKLTNYSRDWVIMKLKFTVPFDTDPNKVKKIFKKIGAEMMADPMFSEGFLEPFKSQGVFDFDDVGMVIRGKFMAKPGAQFTIRKEIYNRVKQEFEANGIAFARREVRVNIPRLDEHEELTDDDKTRIAATAAAAAQQQTTESG